MNAAAEALADSLEALRRALARFDEALAHPGTTTDALLRDGLIQRFEFTFEQFWKTLRMGLSARDIPTGTAPAPCCRPPMARAGSPRRRPGSR